MSDLSEKEKVLMQEKNKLFYLWRSTVKNMYGIHRVHYHEMLDFYWTVRIETPVAKKRLL